MDGATRPRKRSKLKASHSFGKLKPDKKYCLLALVNAVTLLCLIVVFAKSETVFSVRCNIYISRLCYDVSVHLSVRLSVTEVHCGRGACRKEGRGHLALC